MGKPDYSQCAAMVASLPSPIRLQLSAPAQEVLQRIIYLCWTHATKSGRGVAYCVPSERWLAQQVQRSERSIRRYLTVLSRYGLVSWVRRLGPGGTWASNLYQLGKTFLASLYARAGKKVQQIHQRTFLADNDLKKGIRVADPDGATLKSTTPKDIDRAPAPDPLPGGGGRSESARAKIAEILAKYAKPVEPEAEEYFEEEGTQWKDRREMLKSQLAMLRRKGL